MSVAQRYRSGVVRKMRAMRDAVDELALWARRARSGTLTGGELRGLRWHGRADGGVAMLAR